METTTVDAGAAAAAAGIGVGMLLVQLAVAIFYLIVFWKLLAKAGQPGWGILIPIYNTILLLRVAGKPWWWLFLLIIPLVNIIFALLICLGVAENFGKSAGFGVGLFFLGFIFYPILAFGSAQYGAAPAQP